MQDKRGYIWFAAQQAGVSRYDGKAFKNFTKADGLIANDVSSICEDRQGNIWFATTEGISRFDGEHFTNYNDKNGLESKIIKSIYSDSNGILWFSTSGGGISRYDGKQFHNYNTKDGLPSDIIFCFLEDKNGNYWLGTSKGLCKFDGKSFTSYSMKDGLSGNKIISLMQDTRGRLWIGSNEAGITIYDGKTFSPYNLEDALNHDSPQQMLEDKHNNVWIAMSHGLLKISSSKKHLFTKKDGLEEDNINSLCLDYEGNLWIGTFNGAVLYRGETFVNFSEKDGLGKKNISAVLQDTHGNYIVASTKGLNIYNGKSITELYNLPELKESNILSLYKDTKELIWLGTESNGAFVLRYKNGTYVKDRVINSFEGKEINTITRIIEDKYHRIWLASYGGGVFVLNENHFEAHYTTTNGLPSNDVTGLYEDRSGNIWISSLQGGVTKFDGKIFSTFNSKNGLPDNSVTPIIETNGMLLFGTPQAGIACYDGKKFSTISTKQGLHSNNITALLADNKNNIWVGSDKGLDKMRINTNPLSVISVKRYSEEKGFNDAEINPHALFMDNVNDIWIGTIDGLERYSAELDFPGNVPPRVELTEIKLFYQTVDWKKYANETDSKTGLPQNLKLSHENNNLTFVFQALTSANINYTYMLQGLDKSWSPLNNGNEAVFTNLSPGDYKFMVQAINSDKVSSQNIVSYSFTIVPPFYKTWWFFSLSIMSLAASIFGFIGWRTKSLRKEKEKLEQTVKLRTAEVVGQKDVADHQRKIAEEKRKEILDSIHYAKRIQDALLKDQTQTQAHLPEHFILFRPKDIVSGDFYWAFEKTSASTIGETSGSRYLYLAVADCTGHGVPGAFLTMLGTSFLNEINATEELLTPAEILNQLRGRIIKELNQGGKIGESKDGMDISLIRLELGTADSDKTLLNPHAQSLTNIQWAGANNPLYHISNNALFETKADKQPIGYADNLNPFTNHCFQIKKGDSLIIFSDGYADQFGGPRGKKFMYKQLKEIFLSHSIYEMKEQKEKLNVIFEEWKGDLEQVDDVCLIRIKV